MLHTSSYVRGRFWCGFFSSPSRGRAGLQPPRSLLQGMKHPHEACRPISPFKKSRQLSLPAQFAGDSIRYFSLFACAAKGRSLIANAHRATLYIFLTMHSFYSIRKNKFRAKIRLQPLGKNMAYPGNGHSPDQSIMLFPNKSRRPNAFSRFRRRQNASAPIFFSRARRLR